MSREKVAKHQSFASYVRAVLRRAAATPRSASTEGQTSGGAEGGMSGGQREEGGGKRYLVPAGLRGEGVGGGAGEEEADEVDQLLQRIDTVDWDRVYDDELQVSVVLDSIYVSSSSNDHACILLLQ